MQTCTLAPTLARPARAVTRPAGAAPESPFGEIEEMELAVELLEVTTDFELDQYLGRVLQRAGAAVGCRLPAAASKVMGGLLKTAVKQVLPSLVPAERTDPNAASGVRLNLLAPVDGRVLGLELEGLSSEDQEFEAAKQLVRLGGAAVAGAASASPRRGASSMARQAATRSAAKHAPGLLRPMPAQTSAGCHCHQTEGRWERRGAEILLHGL